jgi:hypothetical protein
MDEFWQVCSIPAAPTICLVHETTLITPVLSPQHLLIGLTHRSQRQRLHKLNRLGRGNRTFAVTHQGAQIPQPHNLPQA